MGSGRWMEGVQVRGALLFEVTEFAQKATANKITTENTTFAWTVTVYSFMRLYICACCDKQYTELDNQGLNYVYVSSTMSGRSHQC
jgi:hypothetical protein